MIRRLPVALALLLGIFFQPAAAEARKFLDSINDADRAILHDLHNGQIVHAEPFGANQNQGSLWKVKVSHEGRERLAVFKPRSYGDRDGWARTPMEVVMYKLNRILGMDLVPPAAYRRNVTLNGQHFGEGALIAWVPDAHLATNVDSQKWHPAREAFSSDHRILSILGHDADHENSRNVMRGQHWADGKYRVLKVDNEAALRRGAYVNMEHSSATWGPVTRFNPHTFNRMQELNFHELKADIGEFVSDREINKILGARDGVMGHIQSAVASRGPQSVFLTDAEISYDARLRIGKRATEKQVAKFEGMMKKKGVRVEYLPAGDHRLQGAVGKTVLDAQGLTVRLAGKRNNVRMATLMEELVHVNQLSTMAQAAGGLRALRGALASQGSLQQAVKESMESYAKGKVKMTKLDKAEQGKLALSQQTHLRELTRVTGELRSSPKAFWRSGLGTVSTPARAPQRAAFRP